MRAHSYVPASHLIIKQLNSSYCISRRAISYLCGSFYILKQLRYSLAIPLVGALLLCGRCISFFACAPLLSSLPWSVLASHEKCSCFPQCTCVTLQKIISVFDLYMSDVSCLTCQYMYVRVCMYACIHVAGTALPTQSFTAPTSSRSSSFCSTRDARGRCCIGGLDSSPSCSRPRTVRQRTLSMAAWV